MNTCKYNIISQLKTSYIVVEENGSSRTVEEFDRFLMAKVFDISQTADIKDMPEFVDELETANSFAD